jgi:Beta-galactosidase
MRAALLTLLTCAFAVPAAGQRSAFFPVGIDYPADARTSSAEIARDLQAVRLAGFNTIKTAIRWREGEPAPGEYRFDALRRTLEVADRSGVRVILQIDSAQPSWMATRYADVDTKAEPPAPPASCADHPGVRADRLRFVTAASKAAARFASLLAVDVGASPEADPCLVELVDAARQAVPGDVTVDRYGLRIEASLPASERSLAVDKLADAPQGWWLYLGAVPDADRRFAAWMAISRGAQGLIFDDPPHDTGFIRTIARNPELFGQVRPRRQGAGSEARIDGGSGIEVRFLESATVQMIIALNHTPQAQRVTMTFPPETQEAIWLNLETGSNVNFVAGPLGPLYQYWFRPKDALVLMIRKDIREP